MPKHALSVEDPAYRDVDAQSWLPGRFEERVRRAWNAVTGAEIRAAGGDLQRLAEAIQRREGGDVEHILARLRRFRAAEASSDPPHGDPLLRPGAAAEAPPPRSE